LIVKVKSYKRFKNGKWQYVPKHKKKMRSLGKKIRYKKAGTFYVAHDDKGNFRGSRIVMSKSKKK
jgi:hypothetical protein